MKRSKRPARGHRPSRRGRQVRAATPYTYRPPAAQSARLVYTSVVGAAEAAAGTGGFHFFRLNSAYDPDTNLASAAVPGFSEWSQFFSNYRVTSASVRFEGFVSGGSSGDSYATVCLVPNPSQPTLPAQAGEWPVQFGALHRTVCTTSVGGANKVTFDRKYPMARQFRVTDAQFQSDFDFTAPTGANPTRQMYLALTVLGGNTSTPMQVNGTIYIAYIVEFFNPLLFAT